MASATLQHVPTEVCTELHTEVPNASDIKAYEKLLAIVLGEVVAQGGGHFVGVQKQLIPEVPALCLFNGKQGSTYALPIVGLTAMAVAIRIAESDLRFDGRAK